MARIEGAELPIRFELAKGPAVEAWNARKEENNNTRFTSEKLRQSFAESKEDVLSDIGDMLANADKR